LKLLTFSNAALSMWMGAVLSLLSPVVHDKLLRSVDVEEEVIVLCHYMGYA
jgi:hypothetical protein